jgi:hypothetical protein
MMFVTPVASGVRSPFGATLQTVAAVQLAHVDVGSVGTYRGHVDTACVSAVPPGPFGGAGAGTFGT